ncbi:MAG: amino acid adenylation domain-containing protein [Pseudomonadota bacterium]
MNELKQLLVTLHRSGINVYVDNGKLMTKSLPGVITQAIGKQIKDNRHGLLALLQSTAGNDHRPFGQIATTPRGGPLKLSFGQQRLWFINQLDAGGSQYNMPGALKLSGWLDRTSLQSTLDEIVRRHEVLRTTYSSVDGQGVQCIAPARPVPLPVTDLTALAPAERQAELERLALEEATAPFDLEQGPVLRARLLFLSQQEHVLLVTLHHIAADGWSMGIIVREFGQLYEAFSAGRASPLAPLAVQYADYAHWQRQSLDGEQMTRQLGYWQERLCDMPQVHSLPLDFPRPAQQRFDGQLHHQVIAAPLLERLKSMGSAREATLFMVLQSAFALLLGRWSNASDIIMGSPIAGRTQRELEGLVGLFVNTLVLRTTLAPQDSFETLLDNGKRALLDAYAHQDLPFEKLVDAIKPERSLAHSPLFQIVFTLQNTEPGDMRLARLQIDTLAEQHVITKFDLELSAIEVGGQLKLSWNCARSLFTQDTIARMAASFELLLEAIADNPAMPVCALPMVSQQDSESLARWRDSPIAWPHETSLDELFEAQAAAHPDATALICGEQVMSYAQLNVEANRIASVLRARGVGRDTLVGLCLARSAHMVAAVMGILKAGGAYVPLDPAYPRARLDFMLADSALDLVLTTSETAAALDLGARALCLDDPALLAGASATNPVREEGPAGAARLAHIIYTSGSSGKPKGVMIEHCGVARLVLGHDYLQYGRDTVMLHLSSINFDAATFELFGPLLNGGTMVIYPHADFDLERFNALAAEHQVNTLFMTAGLFEQWSAHLPPQGALRTLMSGGDVISPAAVARVYGAMDQVELVALYGPTENSVVASYFKIPRDWPAALALPLGPAIAGSGLAVRDAQGAQVPVGVAGELCLSGAGLARGYLNRPDLDAQVFIGQGAARYYRSGDQARYRADGTLEFLGRIDAQVKVRGFRIELEEIETALVASGEVQEACVLARGDGKDKQLVAYVVPSAARAALDQDALGALLRQALKQLLPAYMTPSTFVRKEQLPLTPNGKLDQKALLAEELPAAASASLAPARNGNEARIAAVWASLLGLPAVGVDSAFFDIGGNSITLIELKYRLQEEGFEFSLKELMENPTVAALAALLGEADRQAAGGALKAVVRMNQCAHGQPLYVIHPFGGGVEGYRPLARALETVCPVYGLQAPFMFGLDFPFEDLSELAQLYADAIVTHSPTRQYSLAGYSGGGKIAAKVAALLVAQGGEVNYVALFDANMQDPDATENEDDFSRLCRFCYSLNAVSSADEVPQQWRALDYAQQLECFADLVGSKRAYVRNEVIAALRFGVHLLRAGCTDPDSLKVCGAVTAFFSSANPALEANRDGWNAVFQNDIDCREIASTHNEFMDAASVNQMLGALSAGLALRAIQAPQRPH